jgi:hypothetical protein
MSIKEVSIYENYLLAQEAKTSEVSLAFVILQKKLIVLCER